jgi:flagella basal body P-ring formation protein FlgA
MQFKTSSPVRAGRTMATVAIVAVALVVCAQGRGRAAVPASASEVIRAAIASRIGSDAEVEVLTVDLPVRPDLPEVFREARPDPSAFLGRPMRFTLVPLTGAPVFAVATLRVIVTHVVTTRALDRSEVLADDTIRSVREELKGMPVRRPLTLSQVNGRRLLRPMSVGAVLVPGSVVVRRAIEPGDKVTVTAVSGLIEVSASLVAGDGGDPGDVIRVFNPETHRDLRGRVVKEGQVEVNYAR